MGHPGPGHACPLRPPLGSRSSAERAGEGEAAAARARRRAESPPGRRARVHHARRRVRSVARPLACCVTPYREVYLGLAGSTNGAAGGREAMHATCAATYAGSHLCHLVE